MRLTLEHLETRDCPSTVADLVNAYFASDPVGAAAAFGSAQHMIQSLTVQFPQGEYSTGLPSTISVPQGAAASPLPPGIGMFDPATATWYLRNSASPGAPDITPFQYGMPGDLPVTGDWNGMGHDGIGVFRPSTATWYLKNTAGPGAPDVTPFVYGSPGWVPKVGHWDSTEQTRIGVIDSSAAVIYEAVPWGTAVGSALGAIPTPGPFQPVPYGSVQVAAAEWFFIGHDPFAYGMPGWSPLTGQWE